MAGMRLRKYGVEATIDFELFEVDGVDLRTNWTPAQSDCEIEKNEGGYTICDNTASGTTTYKIVLTATEMEFARGDLKIVDSATKQFLDIVIHIETYGNASAQHALDLDTALNNFDASATPVEIRATGGTAGINAAELVDAICDEDISKSEHNVANSLAKKIRGIEHVTVLHEGQAQGAGGGNDTIELAETASAVNDWYKDDWVMLVEGTGENQMHHIESYVGDTRTATLGEDWITNPDNSTDYVIIARSSVHTHRFEQDAKNEINAEVDSALSDYGANTTTPPTAAAIVNEWESQSNISATGFKVNVMEVNGTGQTANDNSADINTLITGVNVASEDDIDFGAAKKTSLDAATPDLSAITGDKASYKASGFSTHNAAAVKTAMEAGGSHLTAIKAVTDAMIMKDTTISSVDTADTKFILTDGLTGNDDINNAVCSIYDATGNVWSGPRRVVDYTHSSKLLEINANTAFALQVDDRVVIWNVSYTTTAAAGTITQNDIDSIVDGVHDETMSDHLSPGTTGAKLNQSDRTGR